MLLHMSVTVFYCVCTYLPCIVYTRKGASIMGIWCSLYVYVPGVILMLHDVMYYVVHGILVYYMIHSITDTSRFNICVLYSHRDGSRIFPVTYYLCHSVYVTQKNEHIPVYVTPIGRRTTRSNM